MDVSPLPCAAARASPRSPVLSSSAFKAPASDEAVSDSDSACAWGSCAASCADSSDGSWADFSAASCADSFETCSFSAFPSDSASLVSSDLAASSAFEALVWSEPVFCPQPATVNASRAIVQTKARILLYLVTFFILSSLRLQKRLQETSPKRA